MSKTMNMRFNWLQDRVQQSMFHVYWEHGKENVGDYFTKRFSPPLHTKVRPIYLYKEGLSPTTLLGMSKY